MKLPAAFLDKMKDLMEEQEYNQFINSFDGPRHYGLRANTLKIGIEEFKRVSPFQLELVPWTKDGFYYTEGESPGKHPYYYAGLYYIQEPSAMFPGAILDVNPGDRVLDLCAAPGGKTVQLAAKMEGKGLLVANDINSDRVKALVKNIELCGIKNAIVTNESPERLAVNFSGYFDKILVDAPCSGEGMFRKDEDASKSWEKFKCEKCSSMQREILQSVDRMLKPGGYFVYSTCTFSPEENEKMISEFLNLYPNYEIVDIPKCAGIEDGKPQWADGDTNLKKTARLWPHRVKGEGHFVALLHKKDDVPKSEPREFVEAQDAIQLPECFYDFVKENLHCPIEGFFNTKGNNLYCLPVQYPNLAGIKVAKFGWYLGEVVRDKFQPSHSMIISLKKEDIKHSVDFDAQSEEVFRYLKGETLIIEGTKGWTGICVDGYPLGWAKQTGDMLKNLYPKGWRKMN